MASRNMPAEPDEEGEGALFSCPFCGSEDADCPHFLGSRDLNFCSDFGVDADGGLGQLNEQFEELGESVKAFLAGGYKKSGIPALKPRRLRDLVTAVAAGKNYAAFTEYVKRLGEDTKVRVAAESYEENSGPGFCSTVMMFWVAKLGSTIAGMHTRLRQDISHLNRLKGVG